jgi:hypothetical protein
MARPGQFIFKYLIDKIVEHVKTHFYGFNPLCPTGPNLLGRAAAQLLEMDEFATGEVVRINKNPSTWSYSYLIPSGEVLAVNFKSGNGLASLGASVSNNYNNYWNSKNIYKTESAVDFTSTDNTFFDNFREEIISLKKESIDLITKAQQAEVKAQLAGAKAQQSEAKVQQLEAAVHQTGAQLGVVYASKSWRITAPLRWASGQAKRLKNEGFTARLKAFVKKAIRKVNHELLLRPAFRAVLVGCVSKLGFYCQLNALNQKAYGTYGVVQADPDIEPFITATKSEKAQLSPRAQQIYADLKEAMEHQQKGAR